MALIWITGFSGSGKTTIGKLLQTQLVNQGIKPVLLDGDELREAFGLNQNYSYEDRIKLAYSYARLAKLLSDQGFYVIVATISMFEAVRNWNCKNNKDYLEIYLKVSMDVRKARDPKKLYTSGQNLVESNEIYEEPQNPHFIFDEQCKQSPEEIVSIIQQAILAL